MSQRTGPIEWRLAGPILRQLALQLLAAGVALALFGIGFWWIEPTTPRLIDGLWLAFVTASTIGFGDVVPTTTASRLLAVPTLLLGFAVLSMVTAAIAAGWVESQERRVEREILRDLHGQMRHLHAELAALRSDLRQSTGVVPPTPGVSDGSPPSGMGAGN